MSLLKKSYLAPLTIPKTCIVVELVDGPAHILFIACKLVWLLLRRRSQRSNVLILEIPVQVMPDRLLADVSAGSYSLHGLASERFVPKEGDNSSNQHIVVRERCIYRTIYGCKVRNAVNVHFPVFFSPMSTKKDLEESLLQGF